MVRDKQGIYRGACSRCDCEEYCLNPRSNTTNQRCVYCGHYPPHHWEESESSSHQSNTSDVSESGVARICSGTWGLISLCLRYTLLIKLYLIQIATTTILWILKNSLAPTRIFILFCLCIQPTRFFIQQHSKSQDHEEIVSLALQILYITTLILGVLFTSSIDQSSPGCFVSWLKTSLLVTAGFVILLYWVGVVYKLALFLATTNMEKLARTLLKPLLQINANCLINYFAFSS